MPKLTKNEFKARFRANLKRNGEQWGADKFQVAWDEYRKPKAKQPETPISTTEKASIQGSFSVESQPENILNSTPEAVIEPKPTETTAEKAQDQPKTAPCVGNGDELKELVATVHLLIDDVVGALTAKKIVITAGKQEMLNRTGTQLLNKYDKNGTIAENSPELAYGLAVLATVADVTGQIVKNRSEEKPLEQPKV